MPSGLDVIANAAANVDVYDHSVEIIVIDDVPEVRAVSVSSIDASVYSFQGANELYDPFEQTLNKTLSAKQRVQRKWEDGINSKLNTMNDDDTHHETNIGADVDNKE